MGSKKSPRKIESKQPDTKSHPKIDISKLGIESKQLVICIIMYYTEMFEKIVELKNYRQVCSCLRHALSSWNNKLTKTQLINWRIHDNGRRYTMYTCLISILMNNKLTIYKFQIFEFSLVLSSKLVILGYFDPKLPFLSLKFL